MKKNFLLLLLVVIVLILGYIIFAYLSIRKQTNIGDTTPTQNSIQKQEKIIELDGELVDDAPAFPAYPNSSILNSYRKDFGDRIEYLIIWETTATVPHVTKWYTDIPETSGWNLVQRSDFPDAEDEQMLILSNKTYRVTLLVKSRKATGKTQISAEFKPL